MKRLLMITLLLFAGGSVTAQQANLVRNGGFEDYSACPYLDDQIMLATGWTPIDTLNKNQDHQGNHSCCADYCNVCGTGVWGKIPNNFAGYQYPHFGNGMAMVLMFADIDTSSVDYYVRDYIIGRLTQKLVAGKRYCVSFYVVHGQNTNIAVKDIGAYLDDGSIAGTPFCGIPQSQYTPQVANTGGILTDTLNWTRIEGSFVAKGTERFITIGNFKDRTHTTKMYMPYGTGGVSYYFVDDVSVVESSTVAYAGPDTHVGQGDSVFIGRHDVAMDCSWTKIGSSAVIGTGAGIWVKPTVATSYVVTQTLCGTVTKDTVKVDVWKLGVGSSVNGQTQQYGISPNPNNGIFRINQTVAYDEVVQASVYNMLGRQVYSRSLAFKDGSAAMTLTDIPAGVYYMYLRDGTGCAYERLVKE